MIIDMLNEGGNGLKPIGIIFLGELKIGSGEKKIGELLARGSSRHTAWHKRVGVTHHPFSLIAYSPLPIACFMLYCP